MLTRYDGKISEKDGEEFTNVLTGQVKQIRSVKYQQLTDVRLVIYQPTDLWELEVRSSS